MTENNDKTLAKILKTVSFLKEKSVTFVTKDEFETRIQEIMRVVSDLKKESVTKDEFETRLQENNRKLKGDLRDEMIFHRNEIINRIDSFITLHQKVDLEITSLHAKTKRHDHQIKRIANHSGVEV
ncbi:hypothetical protein KKC60_00790 [Patescibacteria group bacterium]|nr:hypothetical protein [Patescibacteria group bacterium]